MAEANWKDKTPSKVKNGNGKKETALFLQGGGALGAYEAGAYTAMMDAGIQPDWVSGISIGAINAAIIAGNKTPQERKKMLEKFWFEDVGTDHASTALSLTGVNNFFTVKLHAMQNIVNYIIGTHMLNLVTETSVYDPSAMYKTLENRVDFKYLNDPANPTRLSVGAVDIENGELVYFDTKKNITVEQGLKSRSKDSIMRNPQEVRHVRIEPKHIMASGALIPYFPTVEFEKHHYCDGGFVSNTPVRMAYETGQLKPSTEVFRVDLWSRKNKPSKDIGEAVALAKAMQFSSPPINLDDKVKAHIHIACPNRDGHSYNKDFDFSKDSIRTNWDAGKHDMELAIIDYRKKQAEGRGGTINAGNGFGASIGVQAR